jgi:small subunit ribosomal protein S6
MKKSTLTYETVFIINAALEDPAIDAVVEATANVIKNNGGTIDTADKWGRRRLAYPINKKHNGFYAYFLYDAPPALLPQLERYFQFEENIIRHLTVKMTPQALEFRKNFLQNRTERMLPVEAERKAQAAAAAAAPKDAEKAVASEVAEEAAA